MKALKQLYIAVLVLVIGLILIPLFKTESTTQELKGFSARDIQFIESIGFVDNLDGSWSLIPSGLTATRLYYFDFKPYFVSNNRGIINAMQVSSVTFIRVLFNDTIFDTSSPITLWGGDVS